jgi:hypothetical protein
MTEGKQAFHFDPGDQRQVAAIYRSTSAEERSMQTLPHRGRPRLSESDHQHNLNVRRLFNNIIPGLPIDVDPPELHREPDAIESAVATVMKSLGIDTHEWIDDLRTAWSELLPDEIASRTRPIKLENNVLFVGVGSSIAMFELRRTRLKEIEEAVQLFAPEKKIRHVKLMTDYSQL